MPIFGKKAADQAGEATGPPERELADIEEVTEFDKERAVLDQYFDGDLDEPRAPDPPTDPVTLEKDPEQAADEGDADSSIDLMDIFESEEVEDEDLSVLTQDLPHIESESLLALGREVLELLRKDAKSA